MTKKVVSAGALAYAIPFVALAQGGNLSNLTQLVISVGDIVEILIPIAFAAGLLFFFWGLALYISAAGNEEKKGEGKNIMIWGVIALFVMASVWGIVRFIGEALGITNNENVEVPSINDNIKNQGF